MATDDDKSNFIKWAGRNNMTVDADRDLDPVFKGDLRPERRKMIIRWILLKGSDTLKRAWGMPGGSLKKKRRQYRSKTRKKSPKKRSKKPSKKRSKKRTSRRRR